MILKWIKNLKSGLTKSSEKITDGIKTIFKNKKIDKNTLMQLEEHLISSDLGANFSSKIIDEISKKKLPDTSDEKVKEFLRKKIHDILLPLEKKIILDFSPHVILIVGVNGTGKTATVGKLANKFKSDGKKVGMVAADTFRAAAVEQLKIWSERTESFFFSAERESDPAALAYSSAEQAEEQKIDVLLIDTAGRLHNKVDLMNELSKIIRVLKKINNNYPHETILVLDGNIGQNSIKQAEIFKEICAIDSLIVTKLDGTAKGGAIVPIAENLKIPIVALGVGESKDDLIDFKAEEFSKALIS